MGVTIARGENDVPLGLSTRLRTRYPTRGEEDSLDDWREKEMGQRGHGLSS